MRKIIVFLLMAFLFVACKKKEKPTALTWKFKGVTHNSFNTYADFAGNISHQIFGEEKDTYNSILIFTTSHAPGVYQADSTDSVNGATLTWQKSIDTLIVALTPAGSITISENTNNKISGYFNLITGDGDPLDGTFENVPIQ